MSIRTEPEPQPVVEVPPVPVRRGMIQRAADRFPAIESFAYSDFRWLWASALTSYLGMNMQWITRSWLVLKLADDSPLALASVIVTFALPMTLISPIGGALADRISRKRIMLYTQLGNAALTLVVGLLDLAGVIELWHVLVSGLINGSLMAFNMPSRQATVSDIIPQNKLMNGMSLMSSSMNATRILGPALAGVLIIFVGTSGVFFLISGVYALTVLTMLPIRVGREGQKRSGKSMYGDILAGLSYARSSSPLLGLIIMAFIPILFGMSLYALMPAWARETLDVQSDNLGVLYAVMGIGALIGSLGLASIPRFNRRGLLLLSSCVVWGIVLAVVAKMGSYNVVMPMLLFLGLVSSMFMSLNMTLVQTYTSPEMRGRMMSIVMMTFGAMPLSVLPLGALAERIGTANALFASGIMLAVFTVGFAIVYPAFLKIK